MNTPAFSATPQDILNRTNELRWAVPQDFQEKLVESIYGESAGIAAQNTTRKGESRRLRWQSRLDRLLTSKLTGFPAMIFIFAVVLWITIEGANVPSGMLADLMLNSWHPWIKGAFISVGIPWWITGVVVDGMYLTCAWVISVMLPPMAIFFPLFTLLEDFGYLPRVAFNLDRMFQKVGAHGKQALTLSMGYGCNAAGIIATRIIDSPREKLIAILTNNFALCNGRWPTQILIATIFLGALVPPIFAGLTAALAVLTIALIGIGLTFITSWMLSRTVLKGESSSFSLELPPYRPPRFWRTVYTSLIDRTIFVLWRAIVFALPAGVVIWGLSNITAGDQSIAEWVILFLDPMAWAMGLTGVILLAYVVAIPANEIVIPTILMLTVLTTGISVEEAGGAGVMFETDDSGVLKNIFTAGGWTTLTAINLMLFSLCHNPCSTTLYTIFKETKSWKWTLWSALMPTIIGLILCLTTAFLWRLFV